MKTSRIALMAALGVIVAVAAVSFWPKQGASSFEPALAEIRIDNLTCGACAQKVEQAVATLAGTAEVRVDVAAGLARVHFDEARIDGERIAAAITAAGYPARVDASLSAAEYRQILAQDELLAEKYVAQVGERYIERVDFERELAAQQRQGRGPMAEQAALMSLVQRELIQQEALRLDVAVTPQEVAAKLDAMRQAMPGFETMITAQYGDVDTFARYLGFDLLLERLLETHVFNGSEDELQRNALLQAWYRNLQASTPVRLLNPAAGPAGAKAGCACCG